MVSFINSKSITSRHLWIEIALTVEIWLTSTDGRARTLEYFCPNNLYLSYLRWTDFYPATSEVSLENRNRTLVRLAITNKSKNHQPPDTVSVLREYKNSRQRIILSSFLVSVVSLLEPKEIKDISQHQAVTKKQEHLRAGAVFYFLVTSPLQARFSLLRNDSLS